jgi:PST family polysaccharide transporter
LRHPVKFTKTALRELLGRGLLKNMCALWGVQLYRKSAPLVTMPYLARILGPAGWGTVAFVQGFAAFLTLLIEFGFDISATREVARCADSTDKRAELFVGVLGAQGVLALLSGVIVLAIRSWIPIFRDHESLVWAGLLLGVSEAINPSWYLLGMECMTTIAALEIVSKSIAAAGIFILVKSPEQIWVVLVLQALAPLLSTAVTVILVYPELPLRFPSVLLIRRTLSLGWQGFLFRSGESLYTLGNVFVLGLLASPVQVGYFAGAEKISRAFLGLFDPIRQSMYTRLSRLFQESKSEARRLAWFGTLINCSGGLVMGVVIFLIAPFLIHTFLGPSFQPAVGVLRLLAALPPLRSISRSVGFQWLLPLGRERILNRIILSAAVLNLGLALWFGSRFAQTGMAYAVILSEIFVCTSVMWVLSAGMGGSFSPAAVLRAIRADNAT